MTSPISACCFIKDTFRGAFCLFESMASLLPFVDELVVMDLGSTDDTRETLYAIANENKRVKLVLESGFPEQDARVFATLANDVIEWCENNNILYFQADEIWHEDLLLLMEKEFQAGNFDLSFWRIQYRDNFQRVKWFPHIVHRVGKKGSFNFEGDGMNTNRTYDAKMVSNYDAGWFQKWGSLGEDHKPRISPHEAIKPYVSEMITDVSLVGGFRDNIVDRRRMHAPFWHEEPDIEGKPAGQWQEEAEANPDWTLKTSPYNLPAIMRGLVGMTKYELRPELFEALKNDQAEEFLDSCREGWR